MQILKTMTVAGIGSKTHADKAVAEKSQTFFGTMLGKVTGIEPAKRPNQDGSFTNKLRGDFYSKTVEDEFTAQLCILPALVHTSVEKALIESTDASVEFAFEVGVKFMDGRTIPYEFIVKPLMPVEISKPLQKLQALIPSFYNTKVAALPPATVEAPKQLAAPAPAPKHEPVKPTKK